MQLADQPARAAGSLALVACAITLFAIVLAGCAQPRQQAEANIVAQGGVAAPANIPPIDTTTPARCLDSGWAGAYPSWGNGYGHVTNWLVAGRFMC